MFQVGRIISGIGIGILVTICPMYLSEMSPPDIRGWLVGHHAIFLVGGYNLATWVGFGCYFGTDVNENFAWRFPLCIQIVPSLLLLITSFWLPRSPRWLISKGKSEEAWNVLQKLRASPNDTNDVRAREEYLQIHEQLRLESLKLSSAGQNVWKAAWAKKSYRKRMIIGFLTQWGAEFSGPLVIVSFMDSVIEVMTDYVVTEQLCCDLIHWVGNDWLYAITALLIMDPYLYIPHPLVCRWHR